MILTCDMLYVIKKRLRKNQGYDNGKLLYPENRYRNWSLIVIFMLTHCSVPTEGVKSFCMAPTVELGKTAFISCHFGDDISRIQQDVIVYIYKDTGKKRVVQYAWFNGQPTILQDKGYECEKTISEYLVVRIPHTTREHAAQYSCIVAPSDKAEVTPCTLKLTDGSATIEAEHAVSDHKSDVATSSTLQISEFETPSSKGNRTQERGDKGNWQMSLIIALSIVLGILLTLLAITSVYLWKKYSMEAKRWVSKYIHRSSTKSGIAAPGNYVDVPLNDKEREQCLSTIP